MSDATVHYEEAIEELLLAIVEKLEAKDYDLPPLPRIASQVLALSTNPDAEVETLTQLIQQDPVLAAKIFKISNSAAFGPSRRIESLSQAIAWLGLNTIATTAFMESIQSGVFETQGYEAEVQQLWRHAWTTGFYAKSIADVTGNNQDMAFLFGLLHAIGKPFVVHTVNQYQKQNHFSLPWTAVLTIMKDSAKEVGRQLAEAWEFPTPVKEAITLYQDHAFHLGTSPTKAAPITNLAHHLATHFIDPEAISEDALKSVPVIQALHLPEDVMDIFLGLDDTICQQVEAMLA